MLTRFKTHAGREHDLCQDHAARLFAKSSIQLGAARRLDLTEVEAIEPVKRGQCDECLAGRELPDASEPLKELERELQDALTTLPTASGLAVLIPESDGAQEAVDAVDGARMALTDAHKWLQKLKAAL